MSPPLLHPCNYLGRKPKELKVAAAQAALSDEAFGNGVKGHQRQAAVGGVAVAHGGGHLWKE